MGSPEEVIVRAPIQKGMKRPPVNAPMLRLNPKIAPSLKQQKVVAPSAGPSQSDEGDINVGESCKNNGCKVSYAGPETTYSDCVFHPGIPIFHEVLVLLPTENLRVSGVPGPSGL